MSDRAFAIFFVTCLLIAAVCFAIAGETRATAILLPAAAVPAYIAYVTRPKRAKKEQPKAPRELPNENGPKFERFDVHVKDYGAADEGCEWSVEAYGPRFKVDITGKNVSRLVLDTVTIACKADVATLETMQEIALNIAWAGYMCFASCERDIPHFDVRSLDTGRTT